MEKKWIGGVVAGIVIVAILVWQFWPYLTGFTLFGVTKVEIDPQGYEDPVSGEWRGSFWMVTMSTDFDDRVAGFMLQNEDGEPGETFAVSGNGGVVSDKKYTTDDEVDGNVLIPTAQVMVHITPSQPYYEREMEIQQGYYVKEAWSRKDNGIFGWSGQVSPKADAVPFMHYSFADVGGGNWVLHTPFTVSVYKNGDLVKSQEIDTVGGTGVYRIPSSGDEFVNLIDLGKLDTSGYGEPQWDDILYFSENHIFVRSPTADNLLRYDAGETPTAIMGGAVGGVGAEAFSTYWYGHNRWMSDYTPTVTSLSNLPPGFYKDGSTAKPEQPDVFSDVIPYLQGKGIQKVSMPTGFSHLEKVHGQSENYLRVYFKYGTKSSLVIVKISTELADTIVWQPQVANFEITSFPDFGDVANIRSSSITIKCVEGAGSAQVAFTKSPHDAPVSVTPVFGTDRLETGDSVKIPFDIQNLGTPSSMDFSITAEVKNVLGSVTDTATASGRLLEKTGATTIVHVITQYDEKPISNLAVMLEYAGTSQVKTTGLDGLGTATFNLGTSADVSVTASFAGNALYLPKTKTVNVQGGTETTIYLNLLMEGESEPTDLWLWIIVAIIIIVVVAVAIYLWRRYN